MNADASSPVPVAAVVTAMPPIRSWTVIAIRGRPRGPADITAAATDKTRRIGPGRRRCAEARRDDVAALTLKRDLTPSAAYSRQRQPARRRELSLTIG